MLARIGAQESDMRCGGHAPASDAVYRRWLRQGFEPTAACSNCSGKHVGMLAAAQAMGETMANYHQPDHPLQQAVKRVVAQVCGLPADAVGWAIDGCNLPTPAFPLDKLAGLFCQLAHATDTAPPSAALARIYRAMTSYPELVGGEGRFCTTLMQTFGGSLVGKVGADACYGLGVRASDVTRQLGARGALGIAVKIEDGNVQVLQATVCEVLQQLGIGSQEQRQALESFHHPKIVNTMQVEVGRYVFGFELA
jgi:L-asparaginase II